MKTIDLHSVWDPNQQICLNRLIEILEKLKVQNGGNALLQLDAGHNNITAELLTGTDY